MNKSTTVFRVNELPLLALRGMVIFPGTSTHLDIGRKKSMLALNSAMATDQLIYLVTQRDAAVEEPTADDLYEVGTVARIRQVLRLPGDNLRVMLEGLYRARTEYIIQTDPHFGASTREVLSKSYLPALEEEALLRNCQELFATYVGLSGTVSPETAMEIAAIDELAPATDKIAAAISVPIEKKQLLLSLGIPAKRAEQLIVILRHELEILELERKIHNKVQEQMDANQKDYYLREQMRAISAELGEEDSPMAEADEYRGRIAALDLPEKSRKHLLKECEKLAKMPSGSHEATVVRGYLDTCLELPWNTTTEDQLDLTVSREVLDRDHYGLDKVKERIIELLAVRQLNAETKGQILCLSGPPGVGKTSIAKSIAEAMGRKYVRVSLGGVRDEADIRGHRKTYIGSMPGRIINAIKQAGTKNPLILLDEIDKMSNDFRGDPSAAMLEVLDPEQNAAFCDHFLEIPFDLSQVLFITTANQKDAIPEPLLDRMDLIELTSYTAEEKFMIAKNHLVKKQLRENGLTAKQVRISDKALRGIIESYTREAGVRRLERSLAKICRKCAKRIVTGEVKSVTVNDLQPYLGPVRYKRDVLNKQDEIGVATGLAWTAVGGETLPVEIAILDGTGKIELTGSLGDVMKESARTAVSYVRSRAKEWGIATDFYKTKDIHIHVPEGAVPKDGPSAGITMTTALVSALTGIPVRRDVAMTGEVSLRGRVLPIGGLREKTMAAYIYGVKTVIIPQDNEVDLAEIDPTVRKALEFVPTTHMDDVLKTALIRLPCDNSQQVMYTPVRVNENSTVRM